MKADTKKMLKPVLFVGGAALGIYILLLLYRLFTRLSSGASAVAGLAADKAESGEISKQTGISASRVDELRQIAYKVADEMETRKGRGFFDNVFHFVDVNIVVKYLKAVKSSDEMRVVKNYYERLYTDNNSMYQDLNGHMASIVYNQIPYKEAIA